LAGNFVQMRRNGWWSAGVFIFAISILFGGDAWIAHHRQAALLNADADRTPADPHLSALAQEMAAPIFHARCAGCHGDDLHGDRRKGVPDLTAGDWLYGFGEVSEIERTIAYGIRSGRPKNWNLASMPAFGTPTPYDKYRIEPLKPDEIRDLAEYVVSLAGPADQAAAAHGHTLYMGKGLCFDCHSDDGRGDPAVGAPSLAGKTWLYGNGTREDLFRSIAHGHAGICPGWNGPPDPTVVRALAVYIYLRSHKA
jgi:cytochrome c oxidase cbb3-type subunit 3